MNQKTQPTEFELYKKLLVESVFGVVVSDASTFEILFRSPKINKYFPWLTGKTKMERPDDGGVFWDHNILSRLDTSEPVIVDYFDPETGRNFTIRAKRTDWFGTKAIIAYVTDTTDMYDERERMREQYQTRITMMSGVSPNALGYIRLNLTQNKISEPAGRYSSALRNADITNCDELFEYCYERCATLNDEKRYSSLFNRQKLVQSLNEGTTRVSLDHRYFLEEDHPTWMTTCVNMVRNPMSGDVEAVLYTIDIQRSKTIEAMLKSVTDNNYDCIFLIDTKEGTFEDIRGGQSFLGQSNNGPQGTDYSKTMVDLLRNRGADLDEDEIIRKFSLETISANLANHHTYHVFFRLYDDFGHKQYKESMFARIGEDRRYICNTIQDVTEIHEMNASMMQNLEDAVKEANSALSVKDEFISKVTREVRTPLNSITGLVDMLHEEADNPEMVHKYAADIESSCSYLNTIIDEIRDIRMVQNQRLVLQPEPINLTEFLQVIRALVKPLAEEKHLTFICEEKSIVHPVVLADRLSMQRVLMNILDNAVEFTPEGGEISLTAREVMAGDREAVLTFDIKDNGIGMSESFLSKAFIPFEREDKDDSKFEGIGLGLSIAQGIMKAMNGNISVDSRKNQGSVFHIEVRLPIAFARKPVSYEEGNENKVHDFAGRRILLVEDHPLNLDIAKKLLLKVNFEVMTAVNGREAVEIYEKEGETFDAILMDIRMPVMNGLEAARMIRLLEKESRMRKVPIIALTVNAFENDEEESYLAGMNEHLTKPLNPKKMYDTLAHFVK